MIAVMHKLQTALDRLHQLLFVTFYIYYCSMISDFCGAVGLKCGASKSHFNCMGEYIYAYMGLRRHVEYGGVEPPVL